MTFQIFCITYLSVHTSSFIFPINQQNDRITYISKKRNNPSLIFCNPCLYLLSRQKIEWKINILITFHSSLMFTARLQISQDYSHFSEKSNDLAPSYSWLSLHTHKIQGNQWFLVLEENAIEHGPRTWATC